jgi:hypothetical protein
MLHYADRPKKWYPVDVTETRVMASLRASGGHRLNVVLRNMTAYGFACEFSSELAIGEQVWLKFPGFGSLEVVVTKRSGYLYSLVFCHPLHPAVRDYIFAHFSRESISRMAA